MIGEGYSWEAKKRMKAAKPKARKTKARIALTARVSRRCFLFTETGYKGPGWDATIFCNFFCNLVLGPDLRGIFDGIGATWGWERSGAAKGNGAKD